jgi:hypothetical protein
MNDLTENDICVPGEWTCDKCGFVVIKSVISANCGSVGRNMDPSVEPCPNDGTPLRRVRYDEALIEARSNGMKLMEERHDLITERDSLLDFARRIGAITGCNHTDDPDGRSRLVSCVRELIDIGQDVISRLPKTADGVTIVPGMKLHPLHPLPKEDIEDEEDFATAKMIAHDSLSCEDIEPEYLGCNYSSKEAAAAARMRLYVQSQGADAVL